MSSPEESTDVINAIVPNGNHNGKMSNEEVLFTKSLKIQNKRFYLDLKQNNRGKFIKIAEVGVGGRKSRILMSLSMAAMFCQRLSDLVEANDKLPPHDPENLAPEGRLQSSTLVCDNRRYYLDLKENERGRFLRLTMMSPGPRCQVAIPAQGIAEFCTDLEDLLKEVPLEEQESCQSNLPEPKSLRVESKMFYFDVGANRRGTFLRISEVRADYRTAVTLPERSWSRFRQIINDLADQATSVKKEASADLTVDMEKMKLEEREKAQGDVVAEKGDITVVHDEKVDMAVDEEKGETAVDEEKGETAVDEENVETAVVVEKDDAAPVDVKTEPVVES